MFSGYTELSPLYLSGSFLHMNGKGPEAAFSETFDCSDGLALIEGYNQINLVPLVSGKVRDKEKFSENLINMTSSEINLLT